MAVADKPVLVTGASGFVGAAVARALIKAGREVRVLLRPASDRRNVEGLKLEIRLGSLTDPAALEAALQGCGCLYHVAADYRLWLRNPPEIYANNVEGTRNIMEAALAAGVGRVVYCSSVATLGWNRDGTPADETASSDLAGMVGHYKRSKFLAERVVDELVRARGLPAVIVNPSTPVGPRDIKPTPTGRIILEAASGRMPAYVDTGLNIVHVDDVARGHILAEEKGRVGERYILGGENLSLGAILGQIAELTGRKPPTLGIPARLLWPVALAEEALAYATGRVPFATREGLKMARHKMFFSSAKAERELGFRARPAKEALADSVAWFRQAGMLR